MQQYLQLSNVEPSNSQLNISTEPGLYELDRGLLNNTIVYPFSSNIRIPLRAVIASELKLITLYSS